MARTLEMARLILLSNRIDVRDSGLIATVDKNERTP